MPRAIERERKRLAGKSPGAAERLSGYLGELLVFGPIKDFLGMTRMHRAYTGGEAMGEDTFLFFRALGIDLRQFYGQTETAALTAAQPEGQVRCTASASRCRMSTCGSMTAAKSSCAPAR